ncbi:diguanylate cyclase [Pseudomonas argentinensis]|uniref:diguanylate cyclase n=1 Tax=Phytopseudomonas argentinensis TaxID=289370 RepID=A0A1I3JT66_9GAMM|nr:GGDEF domain-containing protein [Pseudomonas argentinensis]KAB0551013.1 diguanylate cyclase [Pseudomonas argentinensis]SFI63459.1 diguanylate cyclase (GGDEF) domain-containing protein [Pseudomonas argentinensis]
MHDTGRRQFDLPLATGNPRRLVIAAVIFMCGVLLLSTALHVRWDRSQAVAKSTEAMQTLAAALNGQAESTFRIADTVLTALISMHRSGGHGAANIGELNQVARTQIRELGELDGLYMSDAQGQYFLATNANPHTLNNADRRYFQHHRQGPDDGLYIGQPIKGKTTGQWVITLSRGIYGDDGSFQGVALATLNVERFSGLYRSLPLGEQGIVVLAKRDGTILARSESNAQTYLTNISQSPMLQAINQGTPKGAVTLTAIVDGVRRIYGFDASPKYPVLVAVAMPEQEALAAWQQRAWAIGGFALAAVLGVAIMGMLVLRALGKQSAMAIELRAAHQSLASANSTLRTLATEDGLTGLANRRHLDDYLASAFRRARNEAMPLAFALVDVDFFKGYNDAYGHLRGDQALIEICKAMRARVRREGDLVARYGGEEMAIVLPDVAAEQALTMAEQVREAVQGLGIEHRQSAYDQVTVSIGVVAGVPGVDFDDAEAMVAAADRALYAAKGGGRNRVVLAARQHSDTGQLAEMP